MCLQGSSASCFYCPYSAGCRVCGKRVLGDSYHLLRDQRCLRKCVPESHTAEQKSNCSSLFSVYLVKLHLCFPKSSPPVAVGLSWLGTCVRLRRQKWSNGHYSLEVVIVRRDDRYAKVPCRMEHVLAVLCSIFSSSQLLTLWTNSSPTPITSYIGGSFPQTCPGGSHHWTCVVPYTWPLTFPPMIWLPPGPSLALFLLNCRRSNSYKIPYPKALLMPLLFRLHSEIPPWFFY